MDHCTVYCEVVILISSQTGDGHTVVWTYQSEYVANCVEEGDILGPVFVIGDGYILKIS
jgi:hypothetical protein